MPGAITSGFAGGLDLASPALAVPPSRVIGSLNYEPLAEGYGRMEGFERFDGQTPPSAVRAMLLPFDTATSGFTVGHTVVGGTSGATAIVAMSVMIESGTLGTGTAAGRILVVEVRGTFVAGELLSSKNVLRARCAGMPEPAVAANREQQRLWDREAARAQRNRIEAVPGQGPVRGVFEIGGAIYALRDLVGGSAGRLYRATGSGWQMVQPSRGVAFRRGLVEIQEGDQINGQASGATATVRRVMRFAGDWGSTAEGQLVLGDLTGTFAAGENIRRGTVVLASVTGSRLYKPEAGGRLHHMTHNFYGAANRRAVYGATGAGPAFEFDGIDFIPITTGMREDRPTRVFEIAQHLGLTFPGGSVQLSSTAEPLLFDPVMGAAEIGLGAEITDVIQAAETAVILFGVTKIGTLEGMDSESWKLSELTEDAGAEPWTAQRVGQTIYLDRRGLRSLAATSAYGNFKTGTLAEVIAPYFLAKRRAGAVPVLSLVVRAKSQYRLFWSDGTGLTVFMGRKVPEAMPFDMGGKQVTCGCTAELADGTEGVFVGDEDGFVYRLDSGPSFDGAGVRGFVMTPYLHLGAALREKRLHGLTLEMQAAPETRVGVAVQFNYADGSQVPDGQRDFLMTGQGTSLRIDGGGGNWSVATWNNFFWSAPIEGVASLDLDGIGRNMSFIIASVSEPTEPAHILQAFTVHASPRRQLQRIVR